MRGRCHAILFALLLAAPADALGETDPDAPSPCAVAYPGKNEPEQFAWAQICGDNIADFTAKPGDHTLSKRFIETILTDDKYRGALKRHGVRITGARFAEKIDLQNIKLEVELWFEQCRFDNDGGIDLSWLQASQPVGFIRSTVTGPLIFYEAQIASDLHVKESAVGAMDLTGAHIGRTLDLSKSVTGMLDMPGIDVGADLLMREGRYQAADLSGGHVGHTLIMSKSLFVGALAMNNLQVATDLRMDGATFTDEIDLLYSQIGGELDWRGASFNHNIDLTAARVGGALLLGSRHRAKSDHDPGPAKWSSPKLALTARYAKIGIIPRLSDAWPGTLHIVGMTYDGIAYDEDIADVRNDYDSWFRGQKYSRQPYEQLATILQARGEIETATAVRFAERDRDRKRSYSERNWGVAIWLTILWAVIGYGYYPYVSLFTVIAFVAIGVFVLRRSGEGPRNGMPWGVSYSLDMLLPIVRLRERHQSIDIAGWARYYFYFHKIVGWALAAFLAAGLSGLTK